MSTAYPLGGVFLSLGGFTWDLVNSAIGPDDIIPMFALTTGICLKVIVSILGQGFFRVLVHAHSRILCNCLFSYVATVFSRLQNLVAVPSESICIQDVRLFSSYGGFHHESFYKLQ